MKETIWKELQRFIDSIRDEAKSADPDQVSIDFWLFKIERRIKILKDVIEEELKGEREMKAILEFDLNDADERMNHLRCVKAFDMALALFNIVYNQKRDAERVVEYEALMTCNEVIDYIFAKIADEMDSRGIVIDDMIS